MVGHNVYPAFSMKYGIFVNVSIPNNFTIEKATLTLFHNTMNFKATNGTTYYGNAKNTRCYKTSSIPVQQMGIGVAEFYTPSIPSSAPSNRITEYGEKTFSGSETYGPIDITSSISRGFQSIIIGDYVNSPTTTEDGYEKTGYVYGVVDVIGYTNYSN